MKTRQGDGVVKGGKPTSCDLRGSSKDPLSSWGVSPLGQSDILVVIKYLISFVICSHVTQGSQRLFVLSTLEDASQFSLQARSCEILQYRPGRLHFKVHTFCNRNCSCWLWSNEIFSCPKSSKSHLMQSWWKRKCAEQVHCQNWIRTVLRRWVMTCVWRN